MRPLAARAASGPGCYNASPRQFNHDESGLKNEGLAAARVCLPCGLTLDRLRLY
jgi:hypothetical protein